jgi:chromosome segregation ATPase
LKRNFSKERITLDLNAKNEVLAEAVNQKDHLSDLNSKRLGLY